MKRIIDNVVIPDNVGFAELRLERNPDGTVSFDWGVIERICEASDMPIDVFRDGPEDNVAALLVGWYTAHRRNGGDPDPVAEDLIGEVVQEELAGQRHSHPPGKA